MYAHIDIRNEKGSKTRFTLHGFDRTAKIRTAIKF
jgi:hypothetical protein